MILIHSKEVARLHFPMQQIGQEYSNTKDLTQIIPMKFRGPKGVAKQVKTEVITAIYNRYYVNKT